MKDNKKLLIGLKKSKTSIESVIKMIEEGKYCIDIMTQIMSAIGLLKSANESLMRSHLSGCFTEGVRSSDEKKINQMIDEIVKILKLNKR